MRQIRLALGEASLSTERLLVMTEPSGQAVSTELAREFGGMQVALTDTMGGERLLGAPAAGQCGPWPALHPRSHGQPDDALCTGCPGERYP